MLAARTIGRWSCVWLAAGALSALPLWGAPPLSQLRGTDGCISDDGSGPCVLGKTLGGATGVAVSPDGRNVYVASQSDAGVAIFNVDPADGGLTQPGSNEGCVSPSGDLGACEDGEALEGATSVAVSPDGRNVYVASRTADAVLIFDRDPTSGEIDQKSVPNGCVAETTLSGDCTATSAENSIDGAVSVAVSPDGRHVYVAAFDSNSVAVFSRDPATGALLVQSCVSDLGGDCADLNMPLDQPTSVAVSHDGRNVYVTAEVSDAVIVFSRNLTSGGLSEQQCVVQGGSGSCDTGVGLNGPYAIALSVDGRSAYVASRASSSVANFDRDPATGELFQNGCISSTDLDCTPGIGLGDAFGVAVAPDGASVFVAGSFDDTIAIFDRKENTGEIGQPGGTGACYADNGGSCNDGRALNAVAALAVSPDSGNVYAVSFLSSAVTIFHRAVPPYDIDGDGELEPLTDGLLLLRYLFGFTGATLVSGAVDPLNCTRCTALVIEPYLDALATAIAP